MQIRKQIFLYSLELLYFLSSKVSSNYPTTDILLSETSTTDIFTTVTTKTDKQVNIHVITIIKYK